MRFVPLSQLVGGERLANDLINSSMQVLMRKGTILTEKMIRRLKGCGIQSTYIENDDNITQHLNLSKESVKDVIQPQIRYQSVNKMKRSMELFHNNLNRQKKTLKYGDTGISLNTDIKHISGLLIDEVFQSADTTISMADIKSKENYQYEHSVNVAVISVIIGTELGLTSVELENLVYGALLLDVGNQWVLPSILQKEDVISDDERLVMQNHVIQGHEHIHNNTSLNPHIKNIILEHHERLDGSGYPKQLKADQISTLSKIVMVADVYDALTSDRPYRDAFTQLEAFEYIRSNAGTLFDFEIADIFSKKIIPYPVGSYVKLSNNQKGVILSNNPDCPLRPNLRVFGKSLYTTESQFVVNLVETRNIIVEKIIYKI